MNAAHHLTYLQAVVIGLIQGLTELFPVSSLGHTVLIPSWLGGSWAALVRQEDSGESPYLAFIVGLHLATALVLIGYYWREWLRLARGLITSVARRRVETPEQRLAWLIVIATIPVGLAGLKFEHAFRVLFARPDAAAVFLMINGGILLLGERYRRRGRIPVPADGAGPTGGQDQEDAPVAVAAATATATTGTPAGTGQEQPGARRPRPGRPRPERAVIDVAAEQRLAGIGPGSALWIGAAQILALFAGISREGVTMAGGLVRGLSHEDALRFAFLLSTPVILAAGALKVPDLTGPLGAGIRGQVLAGSVAAAATSLLAIVFLARWFRTRTLTPFAVYCLAAGLLSLIRFTIW
jgi:undecaprenyl-diphosphatase